MNENNTPIVEQNLQPQNSNRESKHGSNRGALIVAIVMAVGLFALIALNMN